MQPRSCRCAPQGEERDEERERGERETEGRDRRREGSNRQAPLRIETIGGELPPVLTVCSKNSWKSRREEGKDGRERGRERATVSERTGKGRQGAKKKKKEEKKLRV